MGVLPGLGKNDSFWDREWMLLCDMSRVLMTQIGFVTIVLLAPAIMEDQKLMTWLLSAHHDD